MLYGVVRSVASPMFHMAFRVSVSGLERIPRSGAIVIASNHQAFCDSLFLPLVLPRRVSFIAKAEYFSSRRTGWILRALGQIPMDRRGGAASARALEEALAILRSGGCVGIYPEGTRPVDAFLHRGRTGVARLALAARCPVIPAGIRGTRDIQPIGTTTLRPFKRVQVAFGEPIDVAARYGVGGGADVLALREATDEIMAEIKRLCGQQYVDQYARGAGGAPDAEAEGTEE
ncbi:MAG: lysophospholipid acyltransferase family protein [Acidimicrobiales bacterium]